MSSTEVVFAFVAAINAGDPESIAALMTDEHLFIDSLGNHIAGRQTMLAGWRQYFALFPDYQLQVEGSSCNSDEVLLHGYASGTLHKDGSPVRDGAWKIPAAWRAVVEGQRVAQWQVYADNKPVYELLACG